MHSHHSGDHAALIFQHMADKLRIFHHRCPRLVHTVAVRDLIAQAGAHSRLLRRLLNLKKRASNSTEARMMVKDRRHTVLDTVHISRHRTQVSIMQCEIPVYRPPHPVQDI